jgi:Mn2+/Fe2+ NRAMP family transporter
MSEINHFKVFILFSGDVVMNGQLRWIACMRRKLLATRFIYIVIEDSN